MGLYLNLNQFVEIWNMLLDRIRNSSSVILNPQIGRLLYIEAISQSEPIFLISNQLTVFDEYTRQFDFFKYNLR